LALFRIRCNRFGRSQNSYFPFANAVATVFANREATRKAVAIGMGISVMSAAEFQDADNRCVSLEPKDASLQSTEYVACLKSRRDLRAVHEFFRVAGQFARPSFTVA
jgi:phosphopantetheinyl transferase (holo-ACP synthase)